MRKRIIIYGLGKNFDENKEDLASKYSILGFSDKNENMAVKLADGENFIPASDFRQYDFHMLVICGGGQRAKYDLFYQYMDFLRWEDIVLLEEIEKPYISKDEFEGDMDRYERTNCHEAFHINKQFLYPIVGDIGESADVLDGHYFLQDICVAKKILKAAPTYHYDVGSRVDGFISHLLVFRENIILIDVRKFPYEIPGLEFIQDDAIDFSGIADESVESLSCLHAAEHFGLGRYGDNVDAEAFFTAMKNFERVLCRNGKLYLSVPCGGRDTVFFNAHRMFHPHTVLRAFDDMVLLKFEAVKDYQVKDIDINNEEMLQQLGDYYCGIFTMQKK